MRLSTFAVAAWIVKGKLSEPPALNDSLIAFVNSQNGANWIAGWNLRFSGVSLTDARRLLGVVDTGDVPDNATASERTVSVVPEAFDSREQWPMCFVDSVRDQGSCGSCWAFAAAEVLGDRFCIATGGETRVTLSPQDLIACAYDNKYMLGCEGGVPEYAWRYLGSTGIAVEDCIPYAEADSACPSTCADGATNWKYKASSLRHLSGSATVGSVQQELLAHGPIETSFKVYQDFFSYKSGVYSHITGDLQGKHAVKFVGWGLTEDRLHYWIVANSWGEDWGEKGYFRIAQSVNECGIEESMDFGYPLLPAPPAPSPSPSPSPPGPQPSPTPPAPSPDPVEGSCRLQTDEVACLGTMQYGALCTWCAATGSCEAPRTVCSPGSVAV
jgi:cathepsin B